MLATRKILIRSIIIFILLLILTPTTVVLAAWDISYSWDTGDINTRTTGPIAIIDKDHDGSPYIIAPVSHGVKCYDKTGQLQWTYTGITNGHDVYDMAVGDLNGTGYNDSIVIGSGFYVKDTDGKFAVVDKDGNQLQKFTGNDFATAGVTKVSAVAVDGTDIYVGHNLGVTKFVKSGSSWSEDATAWNKTDPVVVHDIQVLDAGNGKRVFVASRTKSSLYTYQTNGTLDWSVSAGGYFSQFMMGKTDSSIEGKQIVCPHQTGTRIFDKDGNLVSYTLLPNGSLANTLHPPGTNVRTGVELYDADGDGEDEIYLSDMGDDIYVWERTGENTYSAVYSLLDYCNPKAFGGVTSYDIDEDGSREIILSSTDGYLYFYDKTLSTLKKTLYIGHGYPGGMVWEKNMFHPNGMYFTDVSGDGHADLVVAGGLGYVDVYETSGFSEPGELTVDIVDADGNSIINPSMVMEDINFSFANQISEGIFGTASQKIRINNLTSESSWTLSIAAAAGSTAIWNSDGTGYDYNDPSTKAKDGPDADNVGGQLTINPAMATLSGTCSSNGLIKGSSAAFSEGLIDSITLLTASDASTDCYVEMTGIRLSQTIPKEQAIADDYNIDMVLTVIAN